MDPEQVFQKTDKGREEISKRTHRVEAKRRTLLILVDGQSDAASLTEKIAHMGDAMAMLQSLWSEGFIEPIGETQAATPETAPAATSVPVAAPGAAPAPGATPATLEQLKRNACLQIERLMGPDGDALALKIEKTASREEFFAEARKARDALKAFLGPKKAEIFGKAIGLP